MPTEITFDALRLVERFQNAGFSFDQAKMMVTVLAEVIGAEDARIAERYSNKQDIVWEPVGTRSATHLLRQEMKTRIADIKVELVLWVVGIGLLQMALIAGLAVKLAH